MVIELTALEKIAIQYLGKLTDQLKDLKKEIDDDAHEFRMEMRDLHKNTNNKIEEIGRKVNSINDELIIVQTKVDLYQKAESNAESRIWEKLRWGAKYGFILLLCVFAVGVVAPDLGKAVVKKLTEIKELIF